MTEADELAGYAAVAPVGAGNSAVVVDVLRCGPMLSPRVPNLVPILGPRMERETPGQRPRPNYGHPQAARHRSTDEQRGSEHGRRKRLRYEELTATSEPF